MANVVSNKYVCAHFNFGKVIWLGCYFDGLISLEPFMYDFDIQKQNPVLANARNQIYCIYEDDLHESIMNTFDKEWQVKRYRWWDSNPTKEERESNEWEHY